MDAARLLLDRGADVEKRDWFGKTALLEACLYGRSEMVRLLLGRGADASVLMGQGLTALMVAARGREHLGSDHVVALRLLIKDGRVSVDPRSGGGFAALWWACELGHTDRARVLLVEGFIPPSSTTRA